MKPLLVKAKTKSTEKFLKNGHKKERTSHRNGNKNKNENNTA